MTQAVSFRTLAGALISALAALVLAGVGASPAYAGGGCANSDSTPNEASPSELRKAIVCLVQKERDKRDLANFNKDGDLEYTQSSHVEVMLNQDCFKHKCNGERGAKGRIKASGYAGIQPFAFGETIGYARTPQKMVNLWMDSQPHRDIILNESFKDYGAAAGHGAPVNGISDADFATYSLVFARKG